MTGAEVSSAVSAAVSLMVAISAMPIEDVRDPELLRRVSIYTRMGAEPLLRMLDHARRQGRSIGSYDGRRDGGLGRCALWLVEEWTPLLMLLRAPSWLPEGGGTVH